MKRFTILLAVLISLLLVSCGGVKSEPTTTLAPKSPPATDVPVEEPTAQPEPTQEQAAPQVEMAVLADLTANPWQWVSFTSPVEQYDVEMPASYTLAFNLDGTVNIVADCNIAIGSFTTDGSSLTIEVGPMTRAMCPPESRSDDFVKYIGSAAIYFIEDGNLFIDLMADGGTMVFTPASEEAMADDGEGAMAGALTENPWQWVSFTNPVEQYQIADPENYVLTFNADGTLAIKADCNNASGSYTIDGSSLTITIGPMTLAACPPESRSDDFIMYLGSAAIYFFEEGDLFIDLMADGGTMRFSPLALNAGNDTLTALGIDVNAEPFSGELFLGGGEGRWLDPTLISALGGTSEGPGINAGELGPACNVFIPSRPDVAINWEAQENVDALRFFFLSLGDPSLVLVTPSGEVLCNDDLNPLVLDPYIEVKNPEPGRYVAFIGSYESDPIYPGFLVATSQDINPATLDLAQLFPREVDPRGIPQRLSIDMLDLEKLEVSEPQGGKLSTADLPYTSEFTAGGAIGAFNLDQPNPLCTGFISAAPTLRFEWTGDSEPLVMFFESNVDTTLQVLAPDGTFHCDDDINGSENINPGLTITPEQGMYYVWVGSFSPDVEAAGMLTITNDVNAAPAPLTSEDIE